MSAIKHPQRPQKPIIGFDRSVDEGKNLVNYILFTDGTGRLEIYAPKRTSPVGEMLCGEDFASDSDEVECYRKIMNIPA